MGARRMDPCPPLPTHHVTLFSAHDPAAMTREQVRDLCSDLLRTVRTMVAHAGGLRGGDILNITVADQPTQRGPRQVWAYNINLWSCP